MVLHVIFTVPYCVACRALSHPYWLSLRHSPLSSSSWSGPRINFSKIQINEQGRALVPPTWLCDLGQASSPLFWLEPPLQMKGVSLDNPTQLLSPLTNFLFTHAKEIYILKPKVEARISRLLPPQPFNSSPAVWANRVWHFPGFVSLTWA